MKPSIRKNVKPSFISMAFFVLALFIIPSCVQNGHNETADNEGFSSERLERLTATLQEYVDAGSISGCVSLVMRNGNIVYHEAFGKRDIEAGDPMALDALFRIASQSKPIVSVAAMILQEQGKLLITDPVGKYLPEYMDTKVLVDGEVVPARRRITIRDLLTQTSGISYGGGAVAEYWKEAGIQGWYLSDRDEGIRETVRRMASLPFTAHPGESFVYGYSSDILGALIEVASGQPLDVFLQEELFEPLKMTDTFFFVPEEKAGRLATVYSATDDGIEPAPDPGMGVGQGHYVKGPGKNFSGGAGLVSTAIDYARFLQMLLNGGELDGVRILSPRTVALMTVNHLHDEQWSSGRSFGLGFEVINHIGERGVPGAAGDFQWGGAYYTTFWASPQDNLVVVSLTQLLPPGGVDLNGKFRTMIYQAMID